MVVVVIKHSTVQCWWAEFSKSEMPTYLSQVAPVLQSYILQSYIHRADFLLTHLTSLYQLQNTRCFPAAKSCFLEPSGLRKQIKYLSKIMLSKSLCFVNLLTSRHCFHSDD